MIKNDKRKPHMATNTPTNTRNAKSIRNTKKCNPYNKQNKLHRSTRSITQLHNIPIRKKHPNKNRLPKYKTNNPNEKEIIK